MFQVRNWGISLSKINEIMTTATWESRFLGNQNFFCKNQDCGKTQKFHYDLEISANGGASGTKIRCGLV